MNLFLRVVIVWIKSWFKPRIGLLDAFSLVDVCVIDFFLRSGVVNILRRNKWTPLVVYKDMKFLKALRFPGKFVVKSQFLGWDDDAVIAQHVFERAGTVVATGYTVARFIDSRGKALKTSDVAAQFGAPSKPVIPDHALATLARSRRGVD
ncbi:MAG: thioesterase superfamily protein [Alphaproteobacteria bacterium]|nr:MAG: thioesterase superfamily protein [Alphaproteobacteria bacterium]